MAQMQGKIESMYPDKANPFYRPAMETGKCTEFF